MRITSFRIENFRNLRLAECLNVPDFMVVCGGNGCGKSALLEALMTAKERAGSYGNFTFDPRAVSADADQGRISITLQFSQEEREFVEGKFGETCPEQDEVVVEVLKGGRSRAVKRSSPVSRLFSFYSRALGSPGFFDYMTAHRQAQKTELQTWDASFLSDDTAKQTLAAGAQKFQQTKQYLAGLKMGDLQQIQSSSRKGPPVIQDSLEEIREVFDRFFAPMRLEDVCIDTSPFSFLVSTALGEIDVDDLSSGEKEILNIFIRFHQLRPQGAVILLDEADAHLHPDLERRYLEELRRLGRGNQLILTTHSPEMMIAAGSDALYTILKEPRPGPANQLVRVTEREDLHEALSELMGSRGLISFNQRIVFIEGEHASADRAIYEAWYPPSRHNVSFVPAGDSKTVRRTAERVNELLATSVGFQQYFSIVDKDIDRGDEDPSCGDRLFRLPVYHVENLLLSDEKILEVTRTMLGSKCPYKTVDEVTADLKELVFSDIHRKPFVKSMLDAKIATVAKQAYDTVYRRSPKRV
jgi:predicted ATPase